MEFSKIVLASASPRRKELLLQIGIRPEIIVSHVAEKIMSDVPQEVVMELAAQKAMDVAETQNEGTLVIGADTVVAVDGRILGKPKSHEEAYDMIRSLAGRSHQVYTGVCLVLKGMDQETDQGANQGANRETDQGANRETDQEANQETDQGTNRETNQGTDRIVTFYDETDVEVYPMTEEEIREYAASEEPMDKAGAYAVQGYFARYIKGLGGSYANVMGLPVSRLYQEMKKFSSYKAEII